ncbi:MAG TPA: hypothetical protein VMU88_10770, partial [bacterium]|nr:hypothetical protein [bacterium]
ANTLITLYNTRLRCPQATGVTGVNSATGLNPLNQLFGLEYIPCSADVTAPVTSFNSYTFTSQDLSYAVSTAPKNTARWIIQLNNVPVSIGAAGPLTVETRIGAGVTTSQAGVALSAVTASAGATIPGTTIVLNDVPTNLSRTYAWFGKTPPPYTERYQYMGDPRDCPYLDVKVGGPQVSGLVTIGPCSYNWWFKDITNGSTGVDGYLGFLNTDDGWGTTASSGPILMNEDVPRYFQTLRNGLLATTSIWSNVNGWSDYYMGFGGEIGYDQSPFSNSVSYNGTPWTTTKVATLKQVNEIVTESWAGSSRTYVRIPANVGKSGGVSTDMWYAKPWLGELYPDSQFASFWYKNGNLPTAAMATSIFSAATNPVSFYREDPANLSTTVKAGSITYTTTQGFVPGGEIGKSPGPWGCQSFAGGTTSGLITGNTLEHDGGPNNSQTGAILSLATTCFSIFGVPLSGSVSCTRPWDINFTATSGTPKPPEWGIAVTNNGYNNGYSTPVTLSIPAISGTSRIFYNSDDTNTGTWHGTGVVQLSNAASQRAYLIESGLATSAQFGPEQLGKTSMVFLLRTFLDGGLMAAVTQTGHIVQLPLIEEDTPEAPTGQYQNPSVIHVVVNSAVASTTNPWYRFGGLTSTSGNFYTQEYPGYTTSAPLTASTYSEASTQVLQLNFKYALSNNPATWYYMSTGATIAGQAQTGIYNGTYAVTTTSFPVTFAWNVSDTTAFPQADYDVRCEVYRQGYPLHYSFHTITLTVDR